jgi:uncharacterized membrane protein YebE (DUF533 family)
MAGGSLLEDMLEAAVRNGGLRSGGSRGQSGGLGDILGQVLGGQPGGGTSRTQPSGGGLGDILGQVLTGGQGRPGSGGLGDILGTVLGGGQSGSSGGIRPSGSATLGDRMRQQDIRVEGGPRSSRDDDIPVTPRRNETTRAPQRETQPTPAPAPQTSGRGGIEIPEQLKRYGGIAILSILAWKVMQSYQKKTGADAGVASTDGFDPKNVPGGAEGLQNTLVDAMIAATQADGVVDKTEQQQLLGQLDKLGVDANARNDLAKRLGTPVDAASLVKSATTPEIALQIYTASALAISADTPQERQYLDNLAQSLKIEPGLKAQIEQTIGKG